MQRSIHIKRSRILVACMLALLAGVLAWLIHHQWRQHNLNAALLAAIKRNDAPVVASLLTQGADADAREAAASPSFWTLLIDLLHGRPKTADPAPNALVIAFEAWHYGEGDPGNTAIINLLLDRQVDVNCRGEDGATSLLQAVWSNRPELVRRLIARGADVNASDEIGTALYYLHHVGLTAHLTPEEDAHQVEIERMLLRAGAKE